MGRKPAEGRPSFEESLAGLEKSVETLKNGDISLETAMDVYEEGMGHYKACASLLRKAKQKIERLDRDADGEGEEDDDEWV
jgi:exodeoxyribonuclease VII small subunit